MLTAQACRSLRDRALRCGSAKPDGVDNSCSTRRRNAPYCSCLSLLEKERPNASYNSRHRFGQTCFRVQGSTKLGHDVRLIPANYVKPYVKRSKSDAYDAEAICEAVTRPMIRFVAPKSEEQQAVLFLHSARDLIVRQRTQLTNMPRSLLAEFGVIIPQGTEAAVKYAKSALEGEKPALSEIAIDVLRQLSQQLVAMHLRFRWYEMRLHSKLDKRVML